MINLNRPATASTKYSEEELMIRLKVFIGGCLAVTLVGIVFTVLYSIMFVTQPLNAISPVDNKFFELIIPIATFLTGTLSGIMLAGTGKDAFMTGAAQGAKAANGAVQPVPPAPPARPAAAPVVPPPPTAAWAPAPPVTPPPPPAVGSFAPPPPPGAMPFNPAPPGPPTLPPAPPVM